jgi:hypothetical protein
MEYVDLRKIRLQNITIINPAFREEIHHHLGILGIFRPISPKILKIVPPSTKSANNAQKERTSESS